MLAKEKAKKAARMKKILEEKLSHYEFKKNSEAKLWLKAYERVTPGGSKGYKNSSGKVKTLADVVADFSSIKIPREKDVIDEAALEELKSQKEKEEILLQEEEEKAAEAIKLENQRKAEIIGLNRATNSSVSIPTLARKLREKEREQRGSINEIGEPSPQPRISRNQPSISSRKQINSLEGDPIAQSNEELQAQVNKLKLEYEQAKQRAGKSSRPNVYDDNGSTVVDNRSFYGNEIG